MEWPGEKLLIRLFDTLAEKGIGKLLKPGQIKREGLANISVDRIKALVDAQTQREAEEIRLGIKDVSDFSKEIEFAKSGSAHSNVDLRVEPIIDMGVAIEVGKSRVLNDAIRREVNTANIILHAGETLRDDTAIPPEEKVDEDWLFRWRDYTGEISGENLQVLWGRVLAGEVKAPGTYSLRCLDFLRNLSQSEAKLIEVMCGLAIVDFIWRPVNEAYKLPLSFKELLDLEDLGLIGGVTGTLSLQLNDCAHETEDWKAVLVSNGKCLIVSHSDKATTLRVNAYSITKLGVQLLSLGDFQPNVEYMTAMGQSFVSKGFKVKIADVAELTPAYTSWKNAIEIK